MLRIPQRKPYGTMEGNVKKALKVYFASGFLFLVITKILICHSYDALKKGRNFDQEIDAVQKFT